MRACYSKADTPELKTSSVETLRTTFGANMPDDMKPAAVEDAALPSADP